MQYTYYIVLLSNLYFEHVILSLNVIHVGITHHFQRLGRRSEILPEIKYFRIRMMTNGCSMKEITFICPAYFGHLRASTSQTFFRSIDQNCLRKRMFCPLSNELAGGQKFDPSLIHFALEGEVESIVILAGGKVRVL